ncbi:MAG TPA: SapC family protein [Azospirillaceae bacterium]|nr:SapC family protein [Azospirillaceae bacterium]
MTDIPAQDLPLFYQRIVPFDSRLHGDLKLHQMRSFDYAAGTAAVPVVAEEFARLSGTYPILFRVEPSPMALALVGIREGENLFVRVDGTWRPHKPIPAYVQRYPFMLLETSTPNQLALAFDPESGLLAPDAEIPLFENGQQTAVMTEVMKLCGMMKMQADVTRDFLHECRRLDLFVEHQAELVVGGTLNFTLAGFHIIDERRFLDLPDSVWIVWKKRGWIGLVYAHLLSLARLPDIAAYAAEEWGMTS